MNISTEYRTYESPESDLIVAYAWEGKSGSNLHLRDLDEWSERYISDLFKLDQFSGSKGATVSFFPRNGIPASKVLLVGLGMKSAFKEDVLREYGGSIGKSLSGLKASSAVVFLPDLKRELITRQRMGQLVTEGIELGSHTIDEYKSEPKERVIPDSVVLSPANRGAVRQVDRGRQVGMVTAWAQNAVRELVSQPPIYLTPTRLARCAERYASEYGFKCRVLSTPDIKKLKMGCLLAVNAGSDQPPKLIVMEYKGPKARERKICLVGKGVTFDSGGYSLKTPQNMVDMKSDMAGAACVIASIAAAAMLQLPVHVVGIVPSTENLVSGKGYKPGDILISLNRKTVEITNTDAEGRLILADALGYADTFEPDVIVDIATLTGAAKIALGYSGAGMFANDDRLAARLEVAAEASSERIWRMPLWDEFKKYIESDLADIKNSAGRIGSFCTSAAFLSHFVGDNRWGHIDIAGMDVDIKGGSYLKKGSSGFGARLLIEFLRRW